MPDVAPQPYLLIGLLTVTAVILGVLPLGLARLVAPRKPGATKQATYECGLAPTDDAWTQLRVQYYGYALLFVIFDVEIIFIYPWAIVWKSLGWLALAEMALFLGLLAVGLAYAWKKGVLEWE